MRNLFVIIIALTLAGCNGTHKITKNKNVTGVSPAASSPSPSYGVSPVNTTPDTSLSRTVTTSQCAKDFAVLKKLNTDLFLVYQGQFDEINKSYRFYETNTGLLSKDPKELINVELNSKLDLVCSRVKNTVYDIIQKKIKIISDM